MSPALHAEEGEPVPTLAQGSRSVPPGEWSHLLGVPVDVMHSEAASVRLSYRPAQDAPARLVATEAQVPVRRDVLRRWAREIVALEDTLRAARIERSADDAHQLAAGIALHAVTREGC